MSGVLANTVATPGAFTVYVNPGTTLEVNSVAVSGTDVAITLNGSTPIVSGSTVTVDYNATGAYDLEDAYGTKVANFSGQAISNNN